MTTSRTGFAFLFVSLLLLVVLSKDIGSKNKSLLSSIFAFSLIVSHYGTAYLFILILIVELILCLYEKKFRNLKDEFASPTFITLFIVMTFSWYMYTSGIVFPESNKELDKVKFESKDIPDLIKVTEMLKNNTEAPPEYIEGMIDFILGKRRGHA